MGYWDGFPYIWNEFAVSVVSCACFPVVSRFFPKSMRYKLDIYVDAKHSYLSIATNVNNTSLSYKTIVASKSEASGSSSSVRIRSI